METVPSQAQPARPPLGVYSSRCDDKGRVRLPQQMQDFLKTFPDPDFFVTSIDGGSVVRVYPISTWYANENVLEGFNQDPQAAEDFAFLAHYWGGTCTIDGQGRILVPPVLRRRATIEDQKVNLRFFNGAVEIYSEAESERRLARALAIPPETMRALRERGLK